MCNAQVRLSSQLHVLSREQADEDMCRQCVNELLPYHLFQSLHYLQYTALRLPVSMSDSGAARRLEVLAGQLLAVTMQKTSSSGSSVWANVPQVLLR